MVLFEWLSSCTVGHGLREKKGHWGRWEGGSKPAIMPKFSEISREINGTRRSRWKFPVQSGASAVQRWPFPTVSSPTLQSSNLNLSLNVNGTLRFSSFS